MTTLLVWAMIVATYVYHLSAIFELAKFSLKQALLLPKIAQSLLLAVLILTMFLQYAITEAEGDSSGSEFGPIGGRANISKPIFVEAETKPVPVYRGKATNGRSTPPSIKQNSPSQAPNTSNEKWVMINPSAAVDSSSIRSESSYKTARSIREYEQVSSQERTLVVPKSLEVKKDRTVSLSLISSTPAAIYFSPHFEQSIKHSSATSDYASDEIFSLYKPSIHRPSSSSSFACTSGDKARAPSEEPSRDLSMSSMESDAPSREPIQGYESSQETITWKSVDFSSSVQSLTGDMATSPRDVPALKVKSVKQSHTESLQIKASESKSNSPPLPTDGDISEWIIQVPEESIHAITRSITSDAPNKEVVQRLTTLESPASTASQFTSVEQRLSNFNKEHKLKRPISIQLQSKKGNIPAPLELTISSFRAVEGKDITVPQSMDLDAFLEKVLAENMESYTTFDK